MGSWSNSVGKTSGTKVCLNEGLVTSDCCRRRGEADLPRDRMNEPCFGMPCGGGGGESRDSLSCNVLTAEPSLRRSLDDLLSGTTLEGTLLPASVHHDHCCCTGVGTSGLDDSAIDQEQMPRGEMKGIRMSTWAKGYEFLTLSLLGTLATSSLEIYPNTQFSTYDGQWPHSPKRQAGKSSRYCNLASTALLKDQNDTKIYRFKWRMTFVQKHKYRFPQSRLINGRPLEGQKPGSRQCVYCIWTVK